LQGPRSVIIDQIKFVFFILVPMAEQP
jgi:hypothetical protein